MMSLGQKMILYSTLLVLNVFILLFFGPLVIFSLIFTIVIIIMTSRA